MPLYETLTDKSSVVLDIGAAYSRFGFSGEFSPRHIIPSTVNCKKTKANRKIIDYKDKQDLYDLLVEFIHAIYFEYALVSPKDRPVVIVESLLCPTVFRETLAKVLFEHYEISMAFMLPSHLVCLAPLAISTGLVLDIGYKEAVLFPVCYGLPIIHAWQALPLAAEAVFTNLKTLLSIDNTDVKNLSESVLEDIIVRCCFVTKMSRAEELSKSKPAITPCPEVTYPINGERRIKVPGKTRELAFEQLFEEDNDHLSIPSMMLDAILKLNVDLRKTLLENIVLIGGMTMVPGFKARLKEELHRKLNSEDRYKKIHVKNLKFHTFPCKENYAAWLGGAIYGATDILNMKAISREQYLKENQLPDWVNIKNNNKIY